MKPVDRLSCAAIDSKPVDFDFGEGFGETWDIIYPDADKLSLKDCRAVLEDVGVDLPESNPWAMDRAGLLEALDEEPGDEGVESLRVRLIGAIDDETIDGLNDWREAVRVHYQDSDRFTPMMNYYYPLPGYGGDEGADQAMLDQRAGAVALARVHDKIVLALTGGGMDLSWDICEGYMLLGYLPPLHFCRLPELAGTTLTEKTSWIIEGCIRSASVAEGWARETRERLELYKVGLATA